MSIEQVQLLSRTRKYMHMPGHQKKRRKQWRALAPTSRMNLDNVDNVFGNKMQNSVGRKLNHICL